MTTRLVLTDPMSIPRKASTGTSRGRGRNRLQAVAQEQDALHRQRRGARERRHIRRRARRGSRSASGPTRTRARSWARQAAPTAPNEAGSGGHDQAARLPAEGLLERPHDPGVVRHAAHERDVRRDRSALRDRAAEVARDRVAQAVEDLLGREAPLLGVDHVALREHGAAPGDLRGALRGQRDAPEVLDAEAETAGLLVQERRPCRRRSRRWSGSRRCPSRPSVAVALEAHVPRVLAADLEQRLHARQQQLDGPGERSGTRPPARGPAPLRGPGPPCPSPRRPRRRRGRPGSKMRSSTSRAWFFGLPAMRV